MPLKERDEERGHDPECGEGLNIKTDPLSYCHVSEESSSVLVDESVKVLIHDGAVLVGSDCD